jgi:hypothetical protein
MRDSVRSFIEKSPVVSRLAEVRDSSKYNAYFVIFDFIERLEFRFPNLHCLISDKLIGEKPEQKYPRPKTAFSPFSFDKKSTCDNQNDRDR